MGIDASFKLWTSFHLTFGNLSYITFCFTSSSTSINSFVIVFFMYRKDTSSLIKYANYKELWFSTPTMIRHFFLIISQNFEIFSFFLISFSLRLLHLYSSRSLLSILHFAFRLVTKTNVTFTFFLLDLFYFILRM